MKRTYIILIALFVLLFDINNVKAMTLKPSGTVSGKRGEEIELYLTLARNSNEKEVSAVDGIFSYDANILTLVNSSNMMTNWTDFLGIRNESIFCYANLSFDNLITNTNKNIVKITFKINDNAPYGNTQVIIDNPNATDEYGEAVLIEGGSHTIKVLSDINTLSNITVEGSEMIFDENITNYNLIVDSNNTTIEVRKKDSTSTVTGDVGKKELIYGVNTFNIMVTSESGLEKIYTLNITRMDNRSKINTLSSLKVDVGAINFNEDMLNYNLIVENNVSTATIEASLTDDKSMFIEGYDPRTVDLNVGNNIIEIKVKAENEGIKTYTINITREENTIVEDDNAFDDVETNNKTGDSFIIIIFVLAVLSLGIIIFYLIKKKPLK